jgi:hypothetical protein
MSGIPTFGQLFRQKRKESGVGLRQLERVTGLTDAYLLLLEKEKRPAPPLPVVTRIILGLDLPGDDAHGLLVVAQRDRVIAECDAYARQVAMLPVLPSPIVLPSRFDLAMGNPTLVLGEERGGSLGDLPQWRMLLRAPGDRAWLDYPVSDAPPPREPGGDHGEASALA